MMQEFNYYSMTLEGIDKVGKNLILRYIDIISEQKYVIHSRGLMSMLAYTKRYGRKYKHNYKKENMLYVLLDVDYDDWLIRCKINNEPKVNYDKDVAYFELTYKEFIKNGIDVVRYNTSKMTPYQIALEVIKEMEKRNE